MEEVDCGVSTKFPDKFVVIYETKDTSLKSQAISAGWEPQGDGYVFSFRVPGKYCNSSTVVPSSTVKKLGQPSVSVDSGQVKVVLKKSDKHVEDITQYFK
ncbi:hypothetical protein V1264_010654 [Littorina saxatilis]|uniref:Uncharacterized protein n=1 Tax=Littorina saxatilis TaxID=31220 RepID=A0AAN9G0K3_9CAEN